MYPRIRAKIVPTYEKCQAIFSRFSNPQIILVFLLFHRNFNPCSACYTNNTVSCSTLCDNTVEVLAFVRSCASLREVGSLHDHRTSQAIPYRYHIPYLSITHTIFKAFDCNPPLDVRTVYLDISKAFDRVWHDGLIYKLKRCGVSGQLLLLIQSFLKDRKQRTVLNGQSSSWGDISAGVPQGSILGPLFFLVYINDLAVGLKCNVKLFADDTSLFTVVEDSNTAANDMNHDLNSISQWAHA